MWFWWYMLFCDLLIPVTMILCGRWMWKRAPEKINDFMGYRTSRSMKNMDTWKFAQQHSGKLWWKIGWIILPPSIIVHIPFYGASHDSIGTVGGILAAVQVVILICSIFPTEKALKRTFTDDGKRK